MFFPLRNSAPFRYISLITLIALCASGLPAADDLMSRADVRIALQYSKDHHEENIRKQIEISEVPSSPFAETERGKLLAKEFARVGLTDIETDSIGNVLGWRRGKSAHAIVVAAHLDTVFPPGTDFKVKHEGTRLLGTGIEDDSRGLAVILGFAEALRAGKIQTDDTILFVADVGEEGIGNLRGVKYLFNESKYKGDLDAFISIDAFNIHEINNREIGSRRYLITINGPGGHSWANFGRPNPAHALGRIISEAADLQVPSDPLSNRTSYNVGRIGGGTSVNSIPFSAWFEFDMRSISEEEVISLEKKFLAIVDRGVARENEFAKKNAKGVFAQGDLTVEKKLIGLRHAVSGPANVRLTAAAVQSLKELGLGEPALAPGSTDSNAVASLGKPAITLAGGGAAANAHSLNEWFDPTDAYQAIQLLLLTVLHYDATTQR